MVLSLQLVDSSFKSAHVRWQQSHRSTIRPQVLTHAMSTSSTVREQVSPHLESLKRGCTGRPRQPVTQVILLVPRCHRFSQNDTSHIQHLLCIVPEMHKKAGFILSPHHHTTSHGVRRRGVPWSRCVTYCCLKSNISRQSR